MTFKVPELEYDYDALEPFIDAKTMEIHHDKHHVGYVKKLNDAVKGTELEGKEIEEILKNLDSIPKDIRQNVVNNGGGHFNHSLFWKIMTPDKSKRKFKGKVAEAINKKFGSFEDFKEKFKDIALKRFGSGWAWLVSDKNGEISIISTANQDCPLSVGAIPVLGLDVWEHAYYLKYQNKRDEYIDTWFNVINWEKVNEIYEGTMEN